MKAKHFLITLLIAVFIGMSNQDAVSAPFINSFAMVELFIEMSEDLTMNCLNAARDTLELAGGVAAVNLLLGGLGCIFDASVLCIATEMITTAGDLALARDNFVTQAHNCLGMYGPVCGPLPSWFPT